jgi:amino acid adenylation domain-containing protein
MTAGRQAMETVAHPDGRAWLMRGPRLDPPDDGLWTLIAASLGAGPGRVRVVSASGSVTGAEMLALVESVGPLPQGGRVGVHVARSVAMVAATLAVWRAGGAYVPLPTDLPAARIAVMIEGCRPAAIITDQAAAWDGYERTGAVTILGRALSVMRRADAAVSAPCCYIAHTSGTSGTPKAVRVGERALLNRMMSLRRLVSPVTEDRVLFKTSLAFDVHVWEFVLPLLTGCVLVIHDQDRFFDLRVVARLLAAERVTIAGFVPSLLSALLDRPDFGADSALRVLFCGGEAWAPALARRFHERLPGCVLRNSYGPAETTLAVANWLVPAGATRIEIGGPLDNLLFLIEPGAADAADAADAVNAADAADAEGAVSGMLAIGGAQVADGYVSPPTPDPFVTITIDGAPVRFYRTGDDVSLDVEAGTLSFKGRHDHQVKLNGVRIELGEIEVAIRSVEEVEACAVVLLTQASHPCLVATYKATAGQFVDPARVRKRCVDLLPSTHVPSYFREVGSYELNANGKIDRSRIEEMLARQA